MEVWGKFKAGITAAALAGLVVFSAQPASAQTMVKVADPDWTGGLITCRIIEFIIKDWGYEVKRIPIVSGPSVMESVRAGETHYGCEAWPSFTELKEKFVGKFGGDGSVVYLGEVGIVGKSGYYVPRYLVAGDKARKIKAKAPKLKSWKGLNKHKKLFATRLTGSDGLLLGCPVETWSCEDKDRMRDLKLDFEAKSAGSEAAHWRAVRSAYEKGKPFLAYAWEPHWIHAELDLVPVELPEYSKAAWPATGWRPDVPFNFANRAFVKKHPQVAELIKNVRLSNAQQSEMMHQVDVKKRGVDEVVQEWMARNKDVWQAWLPSGA